MLETLNDRERIVIDENEDVRLVGIKFFANSQMDAFVSDMLEQLLESKDKEIQRQDDHIDSLKKAMR